MTKYIGILTAGGDSPRRLNAAIRGVYKTALGKYGMDITGFRDGFSGLMDNHFMRIDSDVVSEVLSVGGTILGTIRDKPHLDAMVCLGDASRRSA